MLSLCIFVDLHVAINNMKQLTVAQETQECVTSAPLTSYKTFLTAVNNINEHKAKFIPEQATKAHRDIALLFL
jgi:hypothetical protein